MGRELRALGVLIPTLPQICCVTSDKCLELSEPRMKTGKGCVCCKALYSLLVHHLHQFLINWWSLCLTWQGGGPGNIDSPELRAQARVWVSEKCKYHHKVLELHSVELECAQLPSLTQSTVCTSVSAGGMEGQWKEPEDLGSRSSPTVYKLCSLRQVLPHSGPWFPPLEDGGNHRHLFAGLWKALPGTHGELHACSRCTPSTTCPLSSNLALNWVTWGHLLSWHCLNPISFWMIGARAQKPEHLYLSHGSVLPSVWRSKSFPISGPRFPG